MKEQKVVINHEVTTPCCYQLLVPVPRSLARGNFLFFEFPMFWIGRWVGGTGFTPLKTIPSSGLLLGSELLVGIEDKTLSTADLPAGPFSRDPRRGCRGACREV